jgi:sugar/nucleoside kinase (ribokinase family)
MPRDERGDRPRPLVAVLGDAALDVHAILGEAPRRGGDVPATIGVGAGGQAANVAVRLVRRGVPARLVAAMGAGPEGILLRDLLEVEGPRLAVAALPGARASLVIVLVDPDGERAMISDRESLTAEALPDATSGATWVHCSGYALDDEETGADVAAFLAQLPRQVRRSVAGGSLSPDPARAGRFRARLRATRPALAVFDLDEARAVLGDGRSSPGDAARALAADAEIAVVTAGKAGASAAFDQCSLEVAAAPIGGEVLDATGAGDAYVAALIARLHDVPFPPEEQVVRDAMAMASLLGARVARVVGAQGRVAGEELSS